MINAPNHERKGGLPSEQYTQGILAQALIIAALAMAHSLYVRGLRRTLLFAGFSLSLATIGEAFAIHGLHMLRHHTQPQVKGVPISAVLGWYNISYASFAVGERLIRSWRPTTGGWLLPWTTAAIATSLDLLMDCMSLDQGLWEWSRAGGYAPEIRGPNGKAGIPIINFLGWIALTSGVVLLYLWTAAALGQQPVKLARVNHQLASRGPALLLLPYYGEALAWAIGRRKFRFVFYSILVPIMLLVTLRSDVLANRDTMDPNLERG